MSVIEKEVRFNTSGSAPAGAVVGKITTAGFHSWGGREYLDFYPIDLAIPSSALPDFCGTLDKAVPGDYLLANLYTLMFTTASRTERNFLMH